MIWHIFGGRKNFLRCNHLLISSNLKRYCTFFSLVYRFSHHFYGHNGQVSSQNNNSAQPSNNSQLQPNRKSRSRERPFQKPSNISSNTSNGGEVWLWSFQLLFANWHFNELGLFFNKLLNITKIQSIFSFLHMDRKMNVEYCWSSFMVPFSANNAGLRIR